MSDGSQDLWKDLSALADAFAGTGRLMADAARRIRAPGVLPDASLCRELDRLRADYADLRERAESSAYPLGVAVPADGSLDSLKGLALLIEAVADAETKRDELAELAGRAAGLVERVLSLRHTHQDDFAPLVECQNAARQLLDRLTGDPTSVEAETLIGLAENDHPFAYLLAMVEGNEGVADDLWESLFDSVGRAFGRNLAAAVARSRVVFAEEPTSPAFAEPAPATLAFATLSVPQLPISVSGPMGMSHEEEPDTSAEDLLQSIVSEAISFLPRGLAALRPVRRMGRGTRRRTAPRVERLETVRLLSCSTISGHVFLDANNDGLFQPGELPLANNSIELRNASGVVVGTAQTDAQGYYEFSTDSTISTAPKTVSESVDVPATRTNFSNGFTLPKFDGSLGTLTSVEIRLDGQLVSQIRAENLSSSSPALITGTVAGDLSLDAAGYNVTASLAAPAGAFNSATYDGSLDFSGTSGTDFGLKTALGSKSVTLSTQAGNDLSGFVGPGTLAGTFTANASSGATAGGNLAVETVSTAQAHVSVVYTYTPENCLASGDYTIVQTEEPPGTLDGKESRDGTVLPPHATGPDIIPVTLGDTDLVNNDFGELKPSTIAGLVYYDANDDGVAQAGEAPIPGTTVALHGTDDLGGAVSLTTLTDGSGAYIFSGLRPGNYQLAETQPAGYLQGKNAVGTPGGTLGNDTIVGIVLPQAFDGVHNNFGELLPAAVNGFVYVDADKNGLKSANEAGIAGVPVTLSGTDDFGASVSLDASTDSAGFYNFPGLRPGTYTVIETAQPAGYDDGQETKGNVTPIANSIGIDVISGIVTPAGATSADNNFGETATPVPPPLPAAINGYVYVDADKNGLKAVGEVGLPAVPIALSGTDTSGNSVTRQTTTDASGFYNFPGLPAGTYTVTEPAQPAGYDDGQETKGNLTPIVNSIGTDLIGGITVAAGETAPNNNFGETFQGVIPQEVFAAINGFVYVDSNKNGLKGAGEPGIPNVAVALSGTDSGGRSVTAVRTTDANGFYSFTGLAPGTYTVTETSQPSGYDDGLETKGNVTPIANSIGTDVIAGITVVGGQTAPNNNFGETVTVIVPQELFAAINGYVYVDLDKNGLKGPGEVGLPNVPVSLSGADTLGNAVTRLGSTDANGFYNFTGLPAGNYTVQEISQPSGYLDGQETKGNVTPIANSIGTDVIAGITVAAGQTAPDNNFGETVLPPPPPPSPKDNPVTVIRVTREGIHQQPTRYVVTFDGPLDPASASDPAHYRLVPAFRNGTFGNHPIPLKLVVYNPADNSVTLVPVHRLNIHYHYQLTITGVLDASGAPILGNGGVAGAPYTTILTKTNNPRFATVPAGPSAQVQKALGWSRFPRLAAGRASHKPTV